MPPNCCSSGDVGHGTAIVGTTAISAEEQRARQRDAVQDVLDVAHGRRARAHAGDEAAVLAQVVGEVDRVEDQRRVEVREEDDRGANYSVQYSQPASQCVARRLRATARLG